MDEWRVELDDVERQEMTMMGIDPGYMDYGARDVLEAFRAGREVGKREGSRTSLDRR